MCKFESLQKDGSGAKQADSLQTFHCYRQVLPEQ